MSRGWSSVSQVRFERQRSRILVRLKTTTCLEAAMLARELLAVQCTTRDTVAVVGGNVLVK